VRAQIGELRKELDKLGGAGVNGPPDEQGALYPSIRQLPILGVKYADLYRRTKIQETVFEVLTQQYELAKVQEAKETPSVKVLDQASHPERKSFPPRTNIVLLGVMFGMATGVFWLIVRHRWDQTETTDPRRRFAEEVFQSIEGHMPWAPPNGSRVQTIAHRIWMRFVPGTGAAKNAGELENRDVTE